MTAQFTFDISKPATPEELKPLYEHILGTPGYKPSVSCGTASKADAEAWLRAGHAAAVEKVGKRSGLLQKMDIVEKIELQAPEIQTP